MERMYFGSNALKSIPESIGLMLNLLELDFSNNSIDDIPISLGKFYTHIITKHIIYSVYYQC